MPSGSVSASPWRPWPVPCGPLTFVAARLEEAFRTLLRLPEMARPRGYANAMPRPVAEMADMAARAENGSLSRIRSQALRRFGTATREEMARMDQALAWPLRFLGQCDDSEVPLLVGLHAMSRAMGTKITKLCRKLGIYSAIFYEKRKVGLSMIVTGLVASGKAPT
jgi:hypothetical protein